MRKTKCQKRTDFGSFASVWKGRRSSQEEGIDIISPHTEPIAMRGYPLLTEFVLTGSFI